MDAKLNCSDRAATFLPPWIGGSRLISLWDMKEYYVLRLVDVAEGLTQCKVIGISEGEKPEGQRKIAERLDGIDAELRYLGLEMTRIHAARIKGRIAKLVK